MEEAEAAEETAVDGVEAEAVVDEAAAVLGRLIAGSPWYLVAVEDGEGDVVEIDAPSAAIGMSIVELAGMTNAIMSAECAGEFAQVDFSDGEMVYSQSLEIAEACEPDSAGYRMLQAAREGGAIAFAEDQLVVSNEETGSRMTFRTPNYVGSWDEALANGLLRCGAPGAVLLVDGPNGRFLEAAGVADVENLTPMETADQFEIGSNTKSFTDVIAVQLQEEGVWSLDDPLSLWLPEIAEQLPYGEQITLRQMAQNQSGIWDYADPLITAAIENDALDQAYTHEEIVAYIIENGEAVAEPGTDEAWNYSSSNFILLGLAIERATGESLGRLYQERIFDPLGMEASFLLEDVPEPGSIVQGYYSPGMGQERLNTTNENGSQMWAAGGIVSTAEDMAKYVQGLASGELFQEPAAMEQMLDFGDQPVAYFSGYGLGIGKYDSPNLNAWGHGGQTAGFETLWAYLPDYETTVIMLTNDAACANVIHFWPQIGASPELLTGK
jgi:D-alanyl-D-alanine carboxypeptidase